MTKTPEQEQKAKAESRRSFGGNPQTETVSGGGASQQRPHIRHFSFDRARGRRERAGEERPSALSLAPLEVAVRRRDAVLAFLQFVPVHRDAHRAAGLAPF